MSSTPSTTGSTSGRSPLLARAIARASATSATAGDASLSRARSPSPRFGSHSVVRAERPTEGSLTEYLIAHCLAALALAVDAFFVAEQHAPTGRAITQAALADGIRLCAAVPLLNSMLALKIKESETREPDTDVATAYGIVLKVGQQITTGDVVQLANELNLLNGGIYPSFTEQDIEVSTFHVGTQSVPGFSAEQDTNEGQGGPTVPQLRILDAFNPQDKAIDLIASGGVTTSLVIPGSGPAMGGEGIAIKMNSKLSNSSHNALLHRGMDIKDFQDGIPWRYMKMACGENPKGHDWGSMPSSRLGTAWVFRERLEKARRTLRAQDDWCDNAKNAASHFGAYAHLHVESRFPDALEDESLVALLRGHVKLQVHCYQVNDIDMMLRNKDEFGFEITAFHHATEAHLLADKIAANNISVAIFADHSLYKREAYKHSVLANLIYEAQKAVHYGLDPDVAFRAVTSVPADKIGAGYRIGQLKAGFDADLVVWDRPPLQLGAHPLRVVVDGHVVSDCHGLFLPLNPDQSHQCRSLRPLTKSPLGTYTVANISAIYASEGVLETGKITVENGIVTCLGPKCASKGTVFDLQDGAVIPGIIAVGVPVGLQEIGQEQGTWDGDAGSKDALDGFVWAKDGVRVGGGSKLQEYAFRSGVLNVVAVPRGNGVVAGVSTVVRTGAEREIPRRDRCPRRCTPYFHRRQRQRAIRLHNRYPILKTPQPLKISTANSPFTQVVAGTLPLVVTVHDPNDISKLLALASPYLPTLKLVIAGATGAWAVADEIGKLKVPVLLQPPRCQAYAWEQRWCIPTGQGGPTAVEILKTAGVPVLFVVEAGWVTSADATSGKVDVWDAVGSVTWRVADAFGIGGGGLGRILVGQRAGFVAFNGGPVGFGYSVQGDCIKALSTIGVSVHHHQVSSGRFGGPVTRSSTL
ncbi:hypothetical protein BCR33DRAFT_787314 [Rhizoclosmatium globosum]|uniref:Amidohydrolase-related domain-containing protein n=1 Tax=Rhizoclosmatium globosum TaxID=329046 RepID=A0A1Y2C260_9FUNG|nr:hypothetical protein BCR33DRAFT_787314 [Rhizoclosmatium globosum]|eukprot:ORY41101.1 hypothetical protein BCR33DRAFT_787314 [Rhizoclosmatium globosum]